jgi:hypothetical protein
MARRRSGPDLKKLRGIIEIDETFVGLHEKAETTRRR